MRRIIPSPVMAICAEIAAKRETHATLDRLFFYRGALGEPPPGSKSAKALDWLRLTNKDRAIQPLDVLGRLIENYMEAPLLCPNNPLDEFSEKPDEKKSMERGTFTRPGKNHQNPCPV